MSGTSKVFRKELLELLRDKRTRSSALFGPFALVVMMLFLFGYLQTTIGKSTGQTIHVIQGSEKNPLVVALQKAKITVKPVANLKAAETMIKDGTAKLVLGLPQDSAGPAVFPIKVEEYYDPHQENAAVTRSVINEVIQGANKQGLEAKLKQMGMTSSQSETFHLNEHEVTAGQATAGEILISLLPYLIIIWAFYGGMGSVGDLVAGEKEKNTLETLLITPVTRVQIAIGKLLALSVICISSSLSTIFGVIVVGTINLPITRPIFEKGMGISPLGMVVILLVLIPTVLMFASTLLAVSTRARNIREAYTQLSLVSFIILLPAVFSQFIGYTDFGRSRWVAAVPILDSATTIRQALLGTFDAFGLIMTIVISTTIGLAVLWYTITLFKREEVLLRI